MSPDIAAAFAAAGDMQGRVVSEGASRSADDEDGAAPDKLCAMAVQMFVAAFGSEAGNCALKYVLAPPPLLLLLRPSTHSSLPLSVQIHALRGPLFGRRPYPEKHQAHARHAG